MRDFPTRDPREAREQADITARNIFESYGGTVQSIKIQTGIGAISGSLTGLKAGPVGAFVGAALGALAGYWRGKAYREQAYAQLDAMGLLERPRFMRRDTISMLEQKFTFMRYPYGEQTALVILPLLQKHFPEMTDAELTEIGTNTQRTLRKFRADHPDIPLALAAEAVLAYYGVIRDLAGEYYLDPEARTGEDYISPPVRLSLSPALSPPISPPVDRKKKPSYLIYYVVGAIILIALYEDS